MAWLRNRTSRPAQRHHPRGEISRQHAVIYRFIAKHSGSFAGRTDLPGAGDARVKIADSERCRCGSCRDYGL